ncbi:MAG: hypothetical protein PWP11_3350 [Thauera sp.]|nr:phage major capsid protein [Thauera sp.]MDI3492073.1 hypothetical protein [Thauera sp.]
MSEELKTAVEAGLNQLKSKLETSMERYEGQLKEAGSVANETRSELKALAEAFEKQQAKLLEIQQKGLRIVAPEEDGRTVGQKFTASDEYKSWAANAGNGGKVRIEVKNTVDTNTTNTFPFQKPGVVPGNFAPLTVRQSLRSIPVTSNAVEVFREASWTNSAAEASHGSAKRESDITFEPYTVNIRTVAHFIKVTNQLLADAPAIAAYIDSRLRDGLAQRVDAQLVNGNGTSPNLSGLTDSGNFTAYTPESDDNLVDAINRLKYLMWVTGNVPDTIYVNPADWGAMERTREGANTGMYLYGLPGMNAGMNPFGVRVVVTKDLAAGKIIAARTTDSIVVYDRQSVTVEMGYVNDDFTKNLVTIRAEERLGLAVERPAGVYYGDFTTT